MIESVFTLALLVQFIVPGWIFRAVFRKFFVVESEAHVETQFLSLAATSLVMLAITWPLGSAFGFDPLGALIASKDAAAFLKELSASPVRWLCQLIVIPAVLSVMWAYVERQAWATKVFTALGLPPMPRHPNAMHAALWAHRKQSPILEITDKKGVVIVARFGPNSAATLSKGWPDLFLETVYRRTSDDRWELDDQCSGVFVPGSDIKTIYFYKNPYEGDSGEKVEVSPTDMKLLAHDKTA